jgi:hypothetical protein
MGWGMTNCVVATDDAWGSASLWNSRTRFRGNVRTVSEASLARDARFRGTVRRAPNVWLRLVREQAPAYGTPNEERSPEAACGDDAARVDATDTPATDADRLLELADEIVILSAHIQAATQRLLALLAEFDRKGGWLVDGHRTCAHWLAHHTGIDLGAAREKVRVARALEALPETRAVMSRGGLSFAKARALTRVATPDTERDLLDYARGASAAGVERLVRS